MWTMGRPALRQVDREPEMKWGLPGWSHGYLGKQIEAVEQKNQWRHTAIYPYFDVDGRISYVKIRFIDKQNDKTFRQFGSRAAGPLGLSRLDGGDEFRHMVLAAHGLERLLAPLARERLDGVRRQAASIRGPARILGDPVRVAQNVVPEQFAGSHVDVGPFVVIAGLAQPDVRHAQVQGRIGG